MRFIKEARILALCTLFTFIFVLPVMAQTTDVGQIQPRLSNIITCSAKLTINQNGMADASGYLNCRPNIQITYMQLTLQKKAVEAGLMSNHGQPVGQGVCCQSVKHIKCQEELTAQRRM